ncbi:MAG TPA: YkvA family protein [Anditalea sp.]|nr:YkvA family protein [Anditalea sp.]
MATIKVTADSYFQKAKILFEDRAQTIAQSKTKLNYLLHSVSEKLQKFAENPQVRELTEHVEVLYRMVKAHINGTYTGLSSRSVGLIALGLIYFITPVDLIPDFIPFIGYVDDMSVLLAVGKSLQTDIVKFRVWENTTIM